MSAPPKPAKNLLAPISDLKLRLPGLFITATDTSVGKTVVTSSIAWALRKRGLKVSVSKPMASGCRHDREGLVAEDAEAIAHFSDCRLPLDVINPVRYAKPVAPAVAADELGEEIDFTAIARSLQRLDEWGDVMLIEGVGGLLVPISATQPQVTVLDLVMALRYPTIVVCRAGLGTLNHTAMTVRLLRESGLSIAGLVINGYIADQGASTSQTQQADASMASNRLWLERMTRLPVLATLPACEPTNVRPERGVIAEEILEAAAMADWRSVLKKQVKR